MSRPSGRKLEQIRDVVIEPNVSKYAEGSCLIRFGDTKVMCCATVEERVPPFLKGQKKGWITAEYGMLPRSTSNRVDREAAKGKQSGRTQEIQRLIGRSLRSVVDLNKLGERQIKIDCDVIEADGGTRTAAISGGFVALYLATQKLLKNELITELPINNYVGAVSVGLYNGEVVLDLDYAEDSKADADANFVMDDELKIIEVQATAEQKRFSSDTLLKMMSFAQSGINHILELQKKAIKSAKND